MEAFEEISDTFEKVDESVITRTDTTSCLIVPNVIRIRLMKVKEINTTKRTSTPTKTAFAGGNGTWGEAYITTMRITEMTQ